MLATAPSARFTWPKVSASNAAHPSDTRQDRPVPPGVDWDMFLGPAPMRPFNPNRFKYNWHWFWDTGNGDIGNQGVHEMDIARWGLGESTLPESVVSDRREIRLRRRSGDPNTQFATFNYGDKQLEFEVRGLNTGGEGNMAKGGGNYVGNLFYGADGWMVRGSAWISNLSWRGPQAGTEMKHVEPEEWATTPHIENFLKAVRSRNHKDLTCDIEEGHLSAALVHMANVSYRTGRKLHFDPKNERFVNDDEANGYLKRKYREPFVIPENV